VKKEHKAASDCGTAIFIGARIPMQMVVSRSDAANRENSSSNLEILKWTIRLVEIACIGGSDDLEQWVEMVSTSVLLRAETALSEYVAVSTGTRTPVLTTTHSLSAGSN
jgi:hypothetical protein